MSSVWKGSLPFVRRIDILYGNRSTVRVYPHHNDVGFWRVWEVGACLANYLIQHAKAVQGRSVMEICSGVGLMVLVVMGLCRPSRFSLTNFSDAHLTNLANNVEMANRHWLEGQGVMTGKGGGADDGESSLGPLSMTHFLKYDTPCLSVSPDLHPAAKISLVPPQEVPL